MNATAAISRLARVGRRGAIVLGAAALAACASEEPVGAARDAPTSDRRAAASVDRAGRHEDARFWVDYGDESFLVDVRFVAFMGQSVVAVRRAKTPEPPEDRRRVDVNAAADISGSSANPADPVYEQVAIDIAETLSAIGRICRDGERFATSRNALGEAKTMYRLDRQVWVVFAKCAPDPSAAG